MINNNYHTPVLLNETIENLITNKDGVYVDLTFGGGGHSKAILKCLSNNGLLVSFDQDKDAIKESEGIKDNRFFLFRSNFCYFDFFLKYLDLSQVDGIFADLGVSSHQFDCSERGFSIRHDAKLDMRMNTEQLLSAFDVVNKYSIKELEDIFYSYGDLANAKAIASVICKERAKKSIETTLELCTHLEKFTSHRNKNKFLAQVFQAIRIEVNHELDALKAFLTKSISMLKPKGRLVVISYHSLEDRLVKRFINNGSFCNEAERDIYGNKFVPLKNIIKKAIEPSEDELLSNNRCRSAKMRVAVKL